MADSSTDRTDIDGLAAPTMLVVPVLRVALGVTALFSEFGYS